jgi:hypothetical protein
VSDETVTGPDENGLVTVCVPPMGLDCSWVITFKRDKDGKAVCVGAYTWDKARIEDTDRLEPNQPTMEIARRKAEEQWKHFQPRLFS